MKRLALLLLVVTALGFTALFPVPEVDSATPTSTTVPDETGQEARTVAHCPWTRTDASIESEFALSALGAFDVMATVPAGGEIAARAEGGGLAFGLLRGDIAGLGVSSAVLEFSERPSGAVVRGVGDATLVTAGCRSGASKVWLVAGGSTLQGETLELRLFNPFPQPARVTIRVTSENDVEPEATLESVTVNAQTTRAIDLSELLSLRETLALSITDPDGLITPMLSQAFEDADGVTRDTAAWLGAGASSEWFFPFTGTPRTPGSLVVMNDGAVPVAFDLDVFTETGSDLGVHQAVLEPRTLMRIPVSDLHEGPRFGVGIRADGPLGAFLIGTGATQRAATEGAARASSNWLLPGPGLAGTRSTVWFMNPGSSEATVTYQAAQGNGALGQAEKLTVPVGTVVSLPVESGIVVRATEPIVAGWVSTIPGATSFTIGIPFGDE